MAATAASITLNANNQALTFAGTTLTYDLNGNLATAQDTGGTATYTWDVRNRLTGLTAPGFAATFAYDALGRRTGKTVQGATTNFVYDGLNPVQEKNGGTVTANLLTGLGIDQLFSRTDGAGTSEVFTDALGSTVALADTSGTVQTSYTYEPFGGTTQSGSANTNSYKYTGREDDGTGLYYYRARYYSPRLQRFISEDPIGFDGGDANLYAYVTDNPVSGRDPLGNFAIPLPLIPLIPPAIDAGMGLLAGGIAGQIISNIMNSSAVRPPAGSLPIDQTPWSGDHGEIKDQVGAGAADKVKISPTGDVWVQNPDGSWTNAGPASDYTKSGKPSGRRGKDRDRCN